MLLVVQSPRRHDTLTQSGAVMLRILLCFLFLLMPDLLLGLQKVKSAYAESG